MQSLLIHTNVTDIHRHKMDLCDEKKKFFLMKQLLNKINDKGHINLPVI